MVVAYLLRHQQRFSAAAESDATSASAEGRKLDQFDRIADNIDIAHLLARSLARSHAALLTCS